jgi:hypothetical protein
MQMARSMDQTLDCGTVASLQVPTTRWFRNRIMSYCCHLSRPFGMGDDHSNLDIGDRFTPSGLVNGLDFLSQLVGSRAQSSASGLQSLPPARLELGAEIHAI